jgi:hypothetical protein
MEVMAQADQKKLTACSSQEASNRTSMDDNGNTADSGLWHSGIDASG